MTDTQFRISKPRLRLSDPDPVPDTARRKKPRLRLNEPLVGVRKPPLISPEALAYALPGGLAKLAYKNWSYAPFIRVIEDKVLQMTAGKSVYVMFSAPPRHGKTMFMSKVLPAWFLGRNPDKRVLLITYQQNYSIQQGRAARNIFKAYGEKVFGLKVADDVAGANLWEIQDHQGGMESVGAGGSITGKGADLLIIDDLVKGWEEAMSLPLLEKRWEWFTTDVYSRLEPGSSVFIIMTRWTPFDVIGHIQEKQREAEEAKFNGDAELDDEASFDEWETINFPAIALENDLLGRLPGEALFPKRFPITRLKKIKAVQDDFWFEALYQGNPVPIKGNMIDVEWFRTRYKEMLERSAYDMIVFSIDTALKETELADFTVIGVWGVKGGMYHLLDVVRDKLGYPQLVETVKAMHRVWNPEHVLIEDKGSGISLIQDLRFAGGYNVWPMDPKGENKVLRMQAETPIIRGGQVVLPETASWLEAFLTELRSFPKGKKDQVDMLSQFLKFMRQSSSGIQMW